MDSAQLPAPQLGRILIAAGLLTEAQLAQALEEQTRTGRRLGEIIVRRGFVSGPALANALAEQHGGVLKTEYGFATGLGGQVAQRAASESGADATATGPVPLLRRADPVAVPTLPTPEPPQPNPLQAESQQEQEPPEPTAPPEPPAPPLPAASPVPAAPPEPAAPPKPAVPSAPPPPQPAVPPADLTRLPEPEAESGPVPEPEPHPEVASPQPRTERDVALQLDPDPVTPPDSVPSGHDDRAVLIASLRSRIEAQEAELAQLRAALDDELARSELQVHVATEERPLAATTPAPVPAEQQYLLCVPTSSGYVLLDRVGAVPGVGEKIAVPEETGEFAVTKVVRLPRNGRPCAYLQRT